MLKPVKNFVMVKMVTTPQVFTQLDFLRTFRPYDDIIKTGSCQNNDFLKRIFLLNSFICDTTIFWSTNIWKCDKNDIWPSYPTEGVWPLKKRSRRQKIKNLTWELDSAYPKTPVYKISQNVYKNSHPDRYFNISPGLDGNIGLSSIKKNKKKMTKKIDRSFCFCYLCLFVCLCVCLSVCLCPLYRSQFLS